MSDVVERAHELLAGITPWPWFVDIVPKPRGRIFVGNRADGRHHGLWAIIYAHGDDLRDLNDKAAHTATANAEFIAAAPELVSELTAQVKQLRREVRSMRRQIEMFLEDGVRERLIVALGASDLAVPDHELGAAVRKARNIAYHELGIEPEPPGLRALPAAKPNTPTPED
ncbi:hypothetical protein SEA_PHAYONCE_60 [Mycobacterium phage Phayonce]|uniref:Uncharacterized protein n=1 Tax=Mycobacterium phage Phayonce TaxID=1647302 RepID=A0A0F6YQ85_9CAUD|nr:hypothetical protein SEA_PHAYONCE_60 [Mycobacterium phage Phayonce]AKF14420.1 hypothetical protein SEA_PHAYONCE_60 [Mycobacterium phage Phayonce]